MAGMYGSYAVTQLNSMFKTTAPQSATCFLALLKSDVGRAGSTSGKEITGESGYVRTAITFADAAVANQILNSAQVVFSATGTWSTVTHFAICTGDTEDVNDVKVYGQLTSSFQLNNLDSATFAANSITVSIS